ncbi:MAG: hypothetical protein WA971_11990 [Microbacterium sp.]
MSRQPVPQARVQNDSAATDERSAGLSRRTFAKGLAWSTPVIAAAAAAPIAAAATGANCVATLTTGNAAAYTYSRLSATSAVFTWSDLFGDGKDFTLTLTAASMGNFNNMAINTANNLVLDSGQQGGEAVPSVRLSLDTLTHANTGGGEQVTVSFALGGTALAVEDLSYKIKDIDGFPAQDGNGGAERVSVSQGAGTIANSTWVQGTGTAADRWRLQTSVPFPYEVVPSSDAGNINMTVASTSAFTLDFIVNNSGRGGTDFPNQNIWIGPFAFTVTNPDCV